MSKRDKAKNPALQKKFNLLSRQELLDFDYLDKLSEEETAFLNTFVSETVNTNFLHDDELKRLNDIKSEIINSPEVTEISEHINALRIDLSEAQNADIERSIKNRIETLMERRRSVKKRNERDNKSILLGIEEQMQKKRDEVLLFPKKKQHKQFYDENNARNADLYNTASRTGALLQLETEEYDNYFANSRNVDYEECLISRLDCAKLEEVEMRVYEVLKKMDSTESRRYITKLDSCKSHDDLWFLLEEIEEWILTSTEGQQVL